MLCSTQSSSSIEDQEERDIPVVVMLANKARPADRIVTCRSQNVARGTIVGISKGAGRILLAGFRPPFQGITLAAREFCNVPAMYGDRPVRSPRRLTGIISNFKAIRKVRRLFFFFGVISNQNRKSGCTKVFGLVRATSQRDSA